MQRMWNNILGGTSDISTCDGKKWKTKMLKQVSGVCTDTNFHAAPRYRVPAAELLPAGTVQEREMPPYTDIQTALTSQTRTLSQEAVKN